MNHAKLKALHYYISQARYVEIQSLLNEGVDFDAKNCNGQTPLLVAARRSYRKVVQLLIDSGADIHHCDDRGWTVLHYASYEGWPEIVRLLVAKRVALDTKVNSKTPLMLAAQWLHRGVVQLLIDSGADTHCADDSGSTVLHLAVDLDCVGIVQALLEKGVDIDAGTFVGKTPLHLAVEKRRMEMANYLLKAGANCNLADDECRTPFGIAVRRKRNYKFIKLCIKKGAYVKPNDYDILVGDPFLNAKVLQNVELSSQAVLNNFNNRDLPLLYKKLSIGQMLPQIKNMKIQKGSVMALEVELAVASEIQANGFCNVFEMVPPVLRILCVKSLLHKPRPVFLSESEKDLKRLAYYNKLEYPFKKRRVNRS